LDARRVTSELLLDNCLENALARGGEGERVFIELQESRARTIARRLDEQRVEGTLPSPWAGIPISIKDLFDLEGQVTRAGSTVLSDALPAAATAPAIARLERAGFVIVGRTNMTEFAYSGVGINPHYGTPRNPYDRLTGRIPGGSSAGAAVSVTDGMAIAGIGTDTGGSCRIPAALTGITGYKPTANRIPLEGVYPLAPSLDSVGPLAASVGCCAVLDDIMAGGEGRVPETIAPGGLKLAVLDHYVTDDLDETVAHAWQRALACLSNAGVELVRIRIPEIEGLPELNARGGIAAAEAYAFHETQLARVGDGYDPRVSGRIRAGAAADALELDRLRGARRQLIAAFERAMEGFDAVLAPTVPIVAPPLDAFATDEAYVRLNLLLLRNPSLFNFLDGCAISNPIQESGEAPVGLMLAAPSGQDLHLLRVAGAVEALI